MREKGVDVLVALALVREAADPEIGLVILASHDTDLAPALDEALDIGTAKVESCWWNPDRRWTGPPQPSGGRRVWNTRLRCGAFERAQDRTDYT
ncbi:NYN domain-containing protein [Pseudonocardia ammonioxydans]|uniref:NYN domain-containing protein n=1 Tax=Pseudonocardia ammonioxydans TaxID=260086 RepID=UPI000B81E376|nr:NYN domain-containing protein [Pseudonocardia ammonioxydans]